MWVVAIEAKGYSKKSVSDDEMSFHKEQARQGLLPRHAWAASVAYSLYDRVKVKYHDPEDEDSRPTSTATQVLLHSYFAETEAAARQLDGDTRNIGNRSFMVMPLREAVGGRVPLDVDRSEVLNNIALIIDRDVAKRANERLAHSSDDAGNERERVEPMPTVSTDTLFIDADRIGISTAG